MEGFFKRMHFSNRPKRIPRRPLDRDRAAPGHPGYLWHRWRRRGVEGATCGVALGSWACCHASPGRWICHLQRQWSSKETTTGRQGSEQIQQPAEPRHHAQVDTAGDARGSVATPTLPGVPRMATGCSGAVQGPPVSLCGSIEESVFF